MRIPLSWLKDFVEISISIEELARRLTLAGLEVEQIHYVGLPLPEGRVEGRSGALSHPETKVSGLAWDREKIVVGELRQVMPHPNADRLVLCRLYDGGQEHTVLTGAPNLFPYTDQGPLETPLKVAYAREGAKIYDGHKPGFEVTTLKRAKIRGVESYSMVCSEKELGISEEHEGVIILDEDALPGTPLVEFMGDAVLDIAITPNMARNANVLGVAREVAALTGASLQKPSFEVPWTGQSIEDRVQIEIREPELNPRFVLGLIEEVKIRPSPYWVQLRLRLAGMRPINNIVDATNYVMIEIGEPLHAFDYDVLVERARGQSPTIITRRAELGERLVTLDEVERSLDDFTVLVTDTAGALSIAGVMGGAESEVSERTTSVLLEGAAWNLINVRRTLAAQRISSEAAYRFSRGVHPGIAELGVRRGLALMQRLAGGTISQGLVDAYPLPPEPTTVEITSSDAQRWLGIDLTSDEMADVLRRLEFGVEVDGDRLKARVPDHRLDIGEEVVGVADLMEEIARFYGYDRIPETLIADELPPQYNNRLADLEERTRDLLVELGFQEVVTYRLTSPELESRRLAPDALPDDRRFVRIQNPSSKERSVMRHSLLASVLEIVQANIHVRERRALFEIGPVYFASEDGSLPDEVLRLVLVLTGPRELPGWNEAESVPMDFFDLKGSVAALLDGLKLEGVRYEAAEHPSFHPGKCARVSVGGRQLGILGEVHPLVCDKYELNDSPVVAATFGMQQLLAEVPQTVELKPVPAYPPVYEDLAIVVREAVSAEQVEAAIRHAGGNLVADVRLFDLYRGEQVGPGRKSLAYSLQYQAPDRTLTDGEVAEVRNRIIRGLKSDLDAQLRQ